MNYNTVRGNPSNRRGAPRRRPLDKDPGEKWYHNLLFLAMFPLTLIYLELVLHLALFGSLSGTFFVYVVLFSLAGGLIMALLTSLFTQKINRIVSLCLMGFVAVYYNVQLIYCKFFGDFFYWDLLHEAGNVANFWRETLGCIISNIHFILLLFVPFALYFIFGRRAVPSIPLMWTVRGIGLVLSVFFLVCGINFVGLHNGDFEDEYYYKSGFSMTEASGRFGVLTALRLDTQYMLFGLPEQVIVVNPGDSTTSPDWGNIFDTTASGGTTAVTPDTKPQTGGETGGETGTGEVTPPPETTEAPKPLDTSPNVLDIDFDSFINSTSSSSLKAAHRYFQSVTPTNKNEYTGLFKGKNLIFITVEGWNKQCISEKLTPTLYKMMTEGFVFDNYYCSMWGGSTATGEYANISGNFYSSASCIRLSAANNMKFSLGNMLNAVGYACNGFHNWTYDYYSRDVAFPNMGYIWHGVNNTASGPYTGTNGWNVNFSRQWPPSDRELALNTLSYITPDKPFHLYYMTVSGHAYQTFGGNANAKANKLTVMSAGLPYTNENVLSYIASEYEVELMVKALCEDLAAKGILEDTVFVMAPDHYPYELNSDATVAEAALAEMYGLPVTDVVGNFDLYRSALIIWSASMEKPVEVKKVCSAIDILPTVLNLFGLDYDSRLLTGKDILSTSEGLLPLNCNNGGKYGSWHWITDYGSYNTKTKVFTPASGVTVNSAQLPTYISHYNSAIAAMNKYSKYILDNDYYGILFGKN